ncbi:TerD family protein [Streptomyces sp. NPDC050625]|uniref:TerD family protein n=1 Tax=Streptomyces sp. NPDC050625 TaxID=3154629 RepID=UPI00343BF9C3
MSDRLAGVGLQQDFVEAIADVCSRDAADRGRLLAQAAAARQTAAKAAGASASRSADAADLVILQQRSLEVSDKLVRAMERATQLERERNDANQMVLVLLAMVDKLHRDIAALAREQDRLRSSRSVHTELEEVHERLTRSEQQRVTAESELERARAERQKADRLAEEATEQVRLLTAELERLRGEAPAPDADDSAQAPGSPLDLQDAVNHSVDDIDLALVKAARHLDDSADRLDQLATELHLDNPSDNSAASNDVSDNLANNLEGLSWAGAVSAADGDTWFDILLMVIQGESFTADELTEYLRRVSRELPIVDALGVSARLVGEALTDPAAELIMHVLAEASAADMPLVVGELRTLTDDGVVYQVLKRVARSWPAADIVDAVESLRADEQHTDAYQMLSAVGRDSPPVQVLKVMQGVTEQDAEWVLDAACRDRPVPELPPLKSALQAFRPTAAHAIEHAYRERHGERPTSYAPHEAGTQGSSSEDFAAPNTMRGGVAETHGDLLPLDTVVRTTATAIKHINIGQHQDLYRLCRDPHSIRQIAEHLFISTAEARSLVTSLVDAGLLAVQLAPAPSTVLTDGDLVDLAKSVTAGTLVFGLGWKSTDSDLELDASALALTGDCVYSDNYFVFYNQLQAPDRSIVHPGSAPGNGDQATILVNTGRLPAEVTRVMFALSLDSGQPNRTLAGVEHPYIRVATPGGREIARYEISALSLSGTAVICGALEKHVGGWAFIAGGRGYAGGLRDVALDHGVHVADDEDEGRHARHALERQEVRTQSTN